MRDNLRGPFRLTDQRRLPEDDLVEWLESGTNDDLLLLAHYARKILTRRLDEADAHGDGPLVNALCHHLRRVFYSDLRW